MSRSPFNARDLISIKWLQLLPDHAKQYQITYWYFENHRTIKNMTLSGILLPTHEFLHFFEFEISTKVISPRNPKVFYRVTLEFLRYSAL